MRFEDYNNRMNDLMSALGLGTQWDVAKMNDATTRRGQSLTHSAAMAGISIQREMLPFQKMGAVADIVQTLSGQYGTTHETGTQQGPAQSAPYTDPMLQAFQGGVAGYQLGHNLQQTYQGAQQPASQPAANYHVDPMTGPG